MADATAIPAAAAMNIATVTDSRPLIADSAKRSVSAWSRCRRFVCHHDLNGDYSAAMARLEGAWRGPWSSWRACAPWDWANTRSRRYRPAPPPRSDYAPRHSRSRQRRCRCPCLPPSRAKTNSIANAMAVSSIAVCERVCGPSVSALASLSLRIGSEGAVLARRFSDGISTRRLPAFADGIQQFCGAPQCPAPFFRIGQRVEKKCR